MMILTRHQEKEIQSQFGFSKFFLFSNCFKSTTKTQKYKKLEQSFLDLDFFVLLGWFFFFDCFRKSKSSSFSTTPQPKPNEQNWTKLFTYHRTDNKNCGKNFKNFHKIDILEKNFIIQKNEMCFIAFHSSNHSSRICYAYQNITEKTKVEDESILIFPEHANGAEKDSKNYFQKENLFKYSNSWRFPSGKIHYSILEKVCLTEISSILIKFSNVFCGKIHHEIARVFCHLNNISRFFCFFLLEKC